MTRLGFLLSAMLPLVLAVTIGGAAAQVPAPAATAPAQGAAEAPATLPGGASSLRETYGDWTVQCSVPDGQRVCSLLQTQTKPESGQRILAIELQPHDGGGAGGALVLPFGLTLAEGATLQIDDAAPEQPIAFKTCLPVGCIIPLSFDAGMVGRLVAGRKLTVNAVAADVGAPVALTVGLGGIGAALSRTQGLMP